MSVVELVLEPVMEALDSGLSPGSVSRSPSPRSRQAPAQTSKHFRASEVPREQRDAALKNALGMLGASVETVQSS